MMLCHCSQKYLLRKREATRERLENGETMKKGTNLKVDNIMELLKFFLESTYFKFRGEIYQQKFGVALDSPVQSGLPHGCELVHEGLGAKIYCQDPR